MSRKINAAVWFLTVDDLNVFKLLIGVSGIGPKGGQAILSVLSPDDLRFAVMADDVKAISSAPGIGKKTAQKLIVELKDKLSIEDALEHAITEDGALKARCQQEERFKAKRFRRWLHWDTAIQKH